MFKRSVFNMKNFRYWLVAKIAIFIIRVLKILPINFALKVASSIIRFIGPKLKRHKLILRNLQNAFPEKTRDEIHRIAIDSWEHMSRLAVECFFLDRLFDFDVKNLDDSRIEVSGLSIFLDLRDNPRPFIIFTGHTGNFELLSIVGAAYLLPISVLFRPPNNKYLAEEIFKFRSSYMSLLIPSQFGSYFELMRQLEKGFGIGLLVDQKINKGLTTTFFGQPVKTNPLLPKLVNQFNCDVYPARCIRLPNNRFRLEIEPKLDIYRDKNGNFDMTAIAQLLNDTVERWVREYPEQWLWYHDRWNIKHMI